MIIIIFAKTPATTSSPTIPYPCLSVSTRLMGHFIDDDISEIFPLKSKVILYNQGDNYKNEDEERMSKN